MDGGGRAALVPGCVISLIASLSAPDENGLGHRGTYRRRSELAMKRNIVNLAFVLVAASAMSMACGDDDDSSIPSGGGKGGSAGSSGAAGKGSAGTSTGGTNTSGTSAGGTNTSGTNAGGKGGSSGTSNAGGPSGGQPEAGAENGGQPAAGAETGGAAGTASGGEAGAGGAGSPYTADMIARGTLIVRNMALCGGCHTASAQGSLELGGNTAFKGGALPAPNLTNDPSGLGNWTDQQVMDAFRNGVDAAGRHLDAAMPYWLFHNMNDADALAVVAFLRSLPMASGAVGQTNPDATTVLTPLSPADFPNSSLQAADTDYAAAQQGKYLVSGIAQCVKCHSTAAAGLPAQSYFSGVAFTSGIFASNITPDATGIATWTAADVVTALKLGTNKAGTTLCGSMPAAAKGYGGMTDADAHAIGVYLTTIPAVSKPTADPAQEPACPP